MLLGSCKLILSLTLFTAAIAETMTSFKIQGIAACAWLIGATLATCDTTGYSQMVTYVKRRPDFTRQQFWDYWQNQHAPKVIPLASYFNITSYQQVNGHYFHHQSLLLFRPLP